MSTADHSFFSQVVAQSQQKTREAVRILLRSFYDQSLQSSQWKEAIRHSTELDGKDIEQIEKYVDKLNEKNSNGLNIIETAILRKLCDDKKLHRYSERWGVRIMNLPYAVIESAVLMRNPRYAHLCHRVYPCSTDRLAKTYVDMFLNVLDRSFSKQGTAVFFIQKAFEQWGLDPSSVKEVGNKKHKKYILNVAKSVDITIKLPDDQYVHIMHKHITGVGGEQFSHRNEAIQDLDAIEQARMHTCSKVYFMTDGDDRYKFANNDMYISKKTGYAGDMLSLLHFLGSATGKSVNSLDFNKLRKLTIHHSIKNGLEKLIEYGSLEYTPLQKKSHIFRGDFNEKETQYNQNLLQQFLNDQTLMSSIQSKFPELTPSDANFIVKDIMKNTAKSGFWSIMDKSLSAQYHTKTQYEKAVLTKLENMKNENCIEDVQLLPQGYGATVLSRTLHGSVVLTQRSQGHIMHQSKAIDFLVKVAGTSIYIAHKKTKNAEEVHDVFNTLKLAVENARSSHNKFFMWCEGEAFKPEILKNMRSMIQENGVEDRIQVGKYKEFLEMLLRIVEERYNQLWNQLQPMH